MISDGQGKDRVKRRSIEMLVLEVSYIVLYQIRTLFSYCKLILIC